LANYWELRCAHGPVSGRFLPLLTSRGCPFSCGFCSIPVMNGPRWRMRSPAKVVDEMAHFAKELGIEDFHWQDVNPTVNEKRIVEISREIIRRGMRIRWQFPAGTKLDALKLETLDEMASAGLHYLSFSPESGSPEMLKRIGKPFNHAHSLRQVRRLRQLSVETQACFVLGFPGETEVDRRMTRDYSRELVDAGVGEVTYFVVSPMPGSRIERELPAQVGSLHALTFTAAWRDDYRELIRWRNQLYRRFFLRKILRRPFAFAASCWRALFGGFRLKMEMFPRRRLRTELLFRTAPREEASACPRGEPVLA
jgi:radical SAM superfamily enzyme YgiQ (UPF0313 family)